MKLKKITECSGAFINDRERSLWEAVNVRSSFSNLLFFYAFRKYFFGEITDENGGLVFYFLKKKLPSVLS